MIITGLLPVEKLFQSCIFKEDWKGTTHFSFSIHVNSILDNVSNKLTFLLFASETYTISILLFCS